MVVTPRRILIINGHPDARRERLCAGLADAYAAGALAKGHEVRRLDVGAMEFPLIRAAEAFAATDLPPAIAKAQASVTWAEHLALVHPLWLGAAPALLKGFMEQVFRYGFALDEHPKGLKIGLLDGRSARVIVTMGMPAPIYRVAFGAFGVRAMELGVLALSGFKPVRHTLIGSVGARSAKHLVAALARVHRLGARAE
jgi:putative NADPH-quinone reductase